MSTKNGGDSPEEISAQLASASFNLSQAREAELRFKKLHTAMASIGVSRKPRQLALIKSALEFHTKIVESLPQQLTAASRAVRNELLSLREGITADAVSQEEMFLASGLHAAKAASALVASIETRVARLQAGQVTAAPSSMPEDVLRRNAKYRSKLPDLTQKDYGVARVPVAFALLPDSGHTSVGYLDQDILSKLGFKSELLDGYAVIHGQVVIGIGREMTHDFKEVKLENGDISKEAVPKMVKERVTKFTNDKPGIVVKRRPKTVLDAANEVKSLLERHTNTKYSLVSERSHGYQGQSYFWLMPASDMTRFSRAFPGGHIRIHSWGFAF